MSTEEVSRQRVAGGSTVGFMRSALRVLDFTLGEMLWSRRTVFMALIVGGPVAIAVLLRVIVFLDLDQEALSGPTVFGLMVWVFYLGLIVPILGVFYGTSLIADEVEDKTITYLFTRPVSRGAVLFGKYLGYLICTSMVVLPSLVVLYFLVTPLRGGSIGANFPALLMDVGLLLIGLAVYGALFALVGAWFKHPLLTGLVFAFGWEPVALILPGYVKNATVAYYLHGLVPHAVPQGALNALQGLFQAIGGDTAAWVNLASLAVIGVAALGGAVWAVSNREYLLDQ